MDYVRIDTDDGVRLGSEQRSVVNVRQVEDGSRCGEEIGNGTRGGTCNL